METKRVAVIGAGIVGVCCALWLQKRGYSVVLLDRNAPGSGTSSGNACTIADYACVPVNNPGLFRKIPYLLFSKDSPLSIDPIYALTHPGWMVQFLSHCRSSKVDCVIRSLGTLLRQTAAGYDPLIDTTKASDLIQQRGCVYVYGSESSHKAAYPYNMARREQGVEFDWLNSDEIKELEPGLKKEFYSGLFFHGARHTVNPYHLVTRFFEYFVSSGGEFIQTAVKELDPRDRSIKLDDGNIVEADKLVLAAGAFSKQIKNMGSDHLPLDTERGYHVQYAGRQSLLQRPVGWAEAGLYATPTNEGLRFAGTIELASLYKPPNPRNIGFITDKAKQMFALEETPQQDWLGFRPTMPDALPVIGKSPLSPNIVYAFGHQHIGLTLAGITGKLVSEIIAGDPTSVDIAPFSPARFG